MIDVLPFNELTDDQRQRWAEVQCSRADLASPFFSSEFAAVVHEVRGDVQVAVLHERGDVRGFLPFHRAGSGIGHPVGLLLNDFQGVISEDGTWWNPKEMLTECRLRRWQFNHLIATEQPLVPYHARLAASPYIDLRHGFDAYRHDRRSAGSRQLDQALRKLRKLSRERGPVRFEFHATSEEAFDALLSWKGDQQQRTGIREVFRYPWVVALLKQLHKNPCGDVTGVLSTLHVGERLVAIHLGLRHERVLHWWIPTYSREFEQYSPGLLLLVQLTQVAETEGFDRIDLGKGDERYKTSLMTGATMLAEGAICRNALAQASWNTAAHAKAWLRQSPLRRSARLPKKLLRRLDYWRAGDKRLG